MTKKNLTWAAVAIVVIIALGAGGYWYFFGPPSQQRLLQSYEKSGKLLTVDSPTPNSKLKTSFEVTGMAKLPGQLIRAKLRDPNYGVLLMAPVRLKPTDVNWTKFKIPVKYTGKYRGKATLEVYSTNRETRKESKVGPIPVVLE